MSNEQQQEEEEYEVEKILAKRGGKYHVKWKGWPLADATWEPAAHLTGSAALIICSIAPRSSVTCFFKERHLRTTRAYAKFGACVCDALYLLSALGQLVGSLRKEIGDK